MSDTVDQVERFKAAGWSAARVDGHDPEAIAAAIEQAQTSDRPTLIACKTTIGFGAPKKAGTSKAHGEPLGADELAGAKAALGWNHGPFEVPDTIRGTWAEAGRRGAEQAPRLGGARGEAVAERARRIRAPHGRRAAAGPGRRRRRP